MQQSLTLRTLPAVLLAAFSGAAGAAGFQLLEQNASGIGNAYAGSAAVAENASTIFFNPAGMTALSGTNVSLGAAAVRPSFKFKDEGSSNTPAAAGSDGGDAGDWGVIPNAYLSSALGDKLRFGIGLSAPFGLATEYDKDWAGRFQATKFDIKSANLNPSLAWQVNDAVSLGIGANWQKLSAVYERQASAGLAVLPGATNAALQATSVKLDVDDDAWGWNVGGLFKLAPNTKVGVSYRSAVKHTLEGTLTSNNQAISPNVNAKAEVKLPDTFIVSVAQQLDDRWEMLGDLSWTGWSSIPKVDIMRTSGVFNGVLAQQLNTDFRDTWRVSLGSNYKYNDAWKLKFGVAYDQTPVKSDSERLVSLPDNNRVWVSVGTQWKPSKAGAVDLGLAYLFVKNTKIDNNQASATNPSANRGQVTGSYDSSVIILGAQYSHAF